MITLDNITVQISSKILLENASAQIPDGAKVGIVGLNGCGKTTLFKVLKQEHDINAGNLYISPNQFQAFVEQEIKKEDLEKPILEYVLGKDKRLQELWRREREASPDELPEIEEQLRVMEAEQAKARTAEILNGLGFNNEVFLCPVKDFSGGWQMRLNLAGALFQYSDILFLDEPTNHLDLEAIIWLENYLKKYKGTILLISHDKDFLNHICENILHFEDKKLSYYRGNYESFAKQYVQKAELAEKAVKKQKERRDHLRSYIDRFRYKASKARQAQSRLKMLEKMEDIEEVAQESTSHFVFPEVKPLPSPMITVENASVGYNGTPVLKKLNFYINQDDRIALLGKNGNGKSTLVKMLSSRLTLLSGSMRALSKLKIGYFNQNQTEELPIDLTPTEYMMSLMPNSPEKTARAYLGNFGLRQEKATTRIGELSGGEKTRLLFAVICLNSPELLIFDEPTNHLDMTGRTALAEAINAYEGAVILISHDFHLLELVADTLWLVHNNTVSFYNGDLEDYRNFLLKKEEKHTPKIPLKMQSSAIKKSSQNLKDSRKIRISLREIEQKIATLEREKNEILSKFAITSGVQVADLQKTLYTIEKDISFYEEQWFALSDIADSK